MARCPKCGGVIFQGERGGMIGQPPRTLRQVQAERSTGRGAYAPARSAAFTRPGSSAPQCEYAADSWEQCGLASKLGARMYAMGYAATQTSMVIAVPKTWPYPGHLIARLNSENVAGSSHHTVAGLLSEPAATYQFIEWYVVTYAPQNIPEEIYS